jgi:hypothetical protein
MKRNQWHFLCLLLCLLMVSSSNLAFAQSHITYIPSPAVAGLFSTTTPLVTITSGPTDSPRVILLIQGIDLGDGQQWEQPLKDVRESGLPAYFFTLDKWDRMEKILSNLMTALDKLRFDYPDAHIDIFAYSAGGAAALVAWSRMPLMKRRNMFLTTIASPLRGYDLMLFAAPFVRWFVGAYVEQMARGFKRELGSRVLSNCRQLINTDCKLDGHSCTRGKPINPQLLSPMLCGPENLFTYEETHQGILTKTIPLLLSSQASEFFRGFNHLNQSGENTGYFQDL